MLLNRLENALILRRVAQTEGNQNCSRISIYWVRLRFTTTWHCETFLIRVVTVSNAPGLDNVLRKLKMKRSRKACVQEVQFQLRQVRQLDLGAVSLAVSIDDHRNRLSDRSQSDLGNQMVVVIDRSAIELHDDITLLHVGVLGR